MEIKNIDQGVELFRSTPGAVLLDVRNEGEYADGHIPGSINLPLMQLPKIDEVVEDLDCPLFVHCLSGGRSAKAVAFLQQQGYTKAVNIGGIKDYTGEVER